MPISTIDEYIAEYPEQAEKLTILRETIKAAAPEIAEKISWGMATFTLNGKNLVHFAVNKKHIGFYPGSSGVEFFNNNFNKDGEFKTTKGGVQLPFVKELPLDIITEVVKYRAFENQA